MLKFKKEILHRIVMIFYRLQTGHSGQIYIDLILPFVKSIPFEDKDLNVREELYYLYHTLIFGPLFQEK